MNNIKGLDLNHYITMLTRLSDRNKREVCHLIGILSYFEGEEGKNDEED